MGSQGQWQEGEGVWKVSWQKLKPHIHATAMGIFLNHQYKYTMLVIWRLKFVLEFWNLCQKFLNTSKARMKCWEWSIDTGKVKKVRSSGSFTFWLSALCMCGGWKGLLEWMQHSWGKFSLSLHIFDTQLHHVNFCQGGAGGDSTSVS